VQFGGVVDSTLCRAVNDVLASSNSTIDRLPKWADSAASPIQPQHGSDGRYQLQLCVVGEKHEN